MKKGKRHSTHVLLNMEDYLTLKEWCKDNGKFVSGVIGKWVKIGMAEKGIIEKSKKKVKRSL